MQAVQSGLRWLYAAGINSVAVSLAGGGETGMKAVVDLFDEVYSDCTGQNGVETALEICTANWRKGFEMCNHLLGMDAGVGPAGPMQRDVLLGHAAEGCLYLSLYGPVMLLTLPAGKGRTVIPDHQFDFPLQG